MDSYAEAAAAAKRDKTAYTQTKPLRNGTRFSFQVAHLTVFFSSEKTGTITFGELRQIAKGNEALSDTVLNWINAAFQNEHANDPHVHMHPTLEIVHMDVIINDTPKGATVFPRSMLVSKCKRAGC